MSKFEKEEKKPEYDWMTVVLKDKDTVDTKIAALCAIANNIAKLGEILEKK